MREESSWLYNQAQGIRGGDRLGEGTLWGLWEEAGQGYEAMGIRSGMKEVGETNRERGNLGNLRLGWQGRHNAGKVPGGKHQRESFLPFTTYPTTSTLSI